MTPFRTTLCFLPLLGLLACGGGSSSPTAASPIPADPEVLILDQSTGTPRLLGMASDGTGSAVLLPDASRLMVGSGFTFRHAQGVAYTLRDPSNSVAVREIRTVSLDGRTDRSLRIVDAATTSRVQLLGIRNGHLAAWLQNSYYLGPVEALPLAGGAPVVHGTQVQDARLGTTSLLYGEATPTGLAYRTALLDAATSQGSTYTGQLLTPLPSGGWLMGSWSRSMPVNGLHLLSGDFAPLRDLAALGGAVPVLGTPQNPNAVQPETPDRVFGMLPEGGGSALMALSRTGAAPIRLDGASEAGWEVQLIGLAGTRLVYQASLTDPATGLVQVAYRSVPVAGGPPAELAPLAVRDGDRVLGLTSTCLVGVSPATQETATLWFLPLDGTAGRTLQVGTDWQGPQAWILGDRVAFVVPTGNAHQLSSVDASGAGPRMHLESAVPLTGENPNGQGIREGRMCFTRGNDLLLLDPRVAAPVVLHAGSARGSFAAWNAQRVFFSVQEPGSSSNPTALWSARPDGSDRRQLSAHASVIETQ